MEMGRSVQNPDSLGSFWLHSAAKSALHRGAKLAWDRLHPGYKMATMTAGLGKTPWTGWTHALRLTGLLRTIHHRRDSVDA